MYAVGSILFFMLHRGAGFASLAPCLAQIAIPLTTMAGFPEWFVAITALSAHEQRQALSEKKACGVQLW